MRVTINGQQREVSSPLTIAQLLQKLELAAERVVVELNREILTQEAHLTPIQEGDRLELIQFVGGG